MQAINFGAMLKVKSMNNGVVFINPKQVTSVTPESVSSSAVNTSDGKTFVLPANAPRMVSALHQAEQATDMSSISLLG